LHTIADDIKQCENKIFNLYKEVLALDASTEAEIRDLMAADTDLTADNALKYGFATSIVNGGEAQLKALKNNAYTSKIAALLINNNKMDNKEIKNQLDKLANGLKNLFKANNLTEEGEPIQVKNSTATADDGTVMYFTEEVLAENVMVFSDEAMTIPVADGIYPLGGNEIYVTGGMVEKIEVAGEDAKKRMEAENASLKAELENLKAENAKVVNSLKSFKTDFEDLKKVIPTDVKNLKDLPKVELTAAQKHIANRKKFN
jgi:hypothetical protein